MIQIPVTENGNSDFDISIDGTVYTFLYTFNTRNQRIYLTVLIDEEVIISEIRLLENGLPLVRFTYLELPDGAFFVAQFSKADDFATLGNFGINEDFSLIFLTSEELAALAV